jgi:antirestriction protein ArdC
MHDLHRRVTDQIIAELAKGVRPWVKPWSETPGLNIPANAVTGRPYSGVNVLLLWSVRQVGQQPRFLTFKQAKSVGGHVRGGEHGTHVVFVKNIERKEDLDCEEPATYRMLKTYTVFNIAQCDNLPETLTAPPPGPNRDQRDQLLQDFVAAIGVRVVESGVANRASYLLGPDLIAMPLFQTFTNSADYYAVLLHEVGHWTGHPSRLDRRLQERFGSQVYAAEELIAELTAAFLCAEFSIDGVVPQAADYIGHYLKLLTDDPRAIFTACSKAQEAVDFLRRRLLAEPEVAIAAGSTVASAPPLELSTAG